MFKYEEDIFLSGQRNMKCISHNDNKRLNNSLLRLAGIKYRPLVELFLICIPIIKIIIVIYASIYTLFKFVVTVISLLAERKDGDVKQYEELYLNFLGLFIDRVKAAGLYETSKYWVMGPNIGSAFAPKDKILVDYRKGICFTDNLTIFKKSINTIWNYLCHEKTLCLVHKVWQFYEVEVGLSKITKNATLYFVNQSDKYAIMFDRLPSRKKVLLQHGVTLNWATLPVPLCNIDKFYTISKETGLDAVKYIMDCKPEIKYFNPTIELTDFNDAKRSILIVVSEMTYYDQERQMLEALKDKDVKLYLKRHPGFIHDQPYRDLQKQYDFTYITEKVFPKVDFVISYYSTLAYEYMAYNIPVYIYMTKEDFNVSEMLSQLEICKGNYIKH